MKDILKIELSISARASDKEVWRTLTDPDELDEWWGEGVTLQPKEGGIFREEWQDDEGHDQLATGKVLKVIKDKEILFTWQEKSWPKEAQTRCQIRIQPQGAQCLITVSHEGWQTLPEIFRNKTMEDFKVGWTYHLKELKAYLEE